MTKSTWRVVTVVVAWSIVSIIPAVAQDLGVPCMDCDETCEAICPGFIAGAEMVILRPYASDPKNLTISNGEETFSLTQPDNSFDICPRFWLGYVGSRGLGARARYFKFDHGLDAESLLLETTENTPIFGTDLRITGAGGLTVYAVDVEAFQQVALGQWNASFGGGVRAGGLGRTFAFAVEPLDEPIQSAELSKEFDGVGPTVFAEFHRPLGCRGLALVANVRGSVLFGQERLGIAGTGDELLGLSASEKHDAIVGVGEIQLGGEWTRPLDCGGNLLVNALWEGQIWSGSGAILDVISNDVGLIGCSIGVGMVR
ncbi:MAG: hypothetical protein GXY83_38555 [Rhodopirellula sp.]|nr:hypothetical protein [Rhodopirellula sp.]